MSSISTTIRTDLQTAARGVSPFSGATAQVVRGNYDWAAGADFFKNIITTGPWLFILPTSGSADGVGFNGDFIIHADLVYGFANDAAYTWDAIEDIIFALIAAWTTYSKWVSGASSGPVRVDWSEPEVRSDLKPVVARTRFAFPCKFVADQGQF